jgi:hypothetical protein
MALVLLTGLLAALIAGAGAAIWLRLDRMRGEIAALRAQLAAMESVGAVRRRARGGEGFRLASVDDQPALFPESKPETATVHRLRAPTLTTRAGADTLRGVALALAAVAPALGVFLGLDQGAATAAGVCVGALMMLLSLRALWPAAAWAAVVATSVWAALALLTGAAEASALAFSAALAFAGVAGLVKAFLLRVAPGAALVLVSGLAALALGGQVGLIGPAGAAFGALVVLAAMVGALNLRLEAIHLVAFAAALVGLFVLSGQDSAAIWFTPVAAWAGALFLGVAAIRVPDLGARGIALAGTGVLAPLCAIAALYWSGHGLAAPLAAAGALVAAAAAFAAVIAAAASRGARTLASLKLTLWVLAGGAFAAVAAAILLVGSAPIAAGAFMLGALGLLGLNGRLPDAAWRTLAWIAGVLAASNACAAAAMVMRENGAPFLPLTLGLAAPMVLAGASAYVAKRQPAPATASLFEALAIVLCVLGANLLLRVMISGGALMLTPISFPEAGLHITLWLIISLLLAARWRYGAQRVRAFAAITLAGMALIASAATTLLWLTPHWTLRAPGADAAALLQFEGLGFLAPSIMFWAHWVLWRGRGANLRARLSLGTGALTLAAMVTLMALQAHEPTAEGPDWIGAVVGAVAFALAIGINFADGVTLLTMPRPSYFEENLQGNRRRQNPRQTR